VSARKPIDFFDGTAYNFLSNFHPTAPIEYAGSTWPTTEHAFQAMKAFLGSGPMPWTQRKHIERIRMSRSPGDAKSLGQAASFRRYGVKLRHDWDDVKWGVMLDILRVKFAQPAMRDLLLATGKRELIEGNSWNDTTWGVCKGIGTNWLGRQLMVVRHELRAQGVRKRPALWHVTLLGPGSAYRYTRECLTQVSADFTARKAVYDAAEEQGLRDTRAAHDGLRTCSVLIPDAVSTGRIEIRLGQANIIVRRFP
jgi:ribA/ribD-fused uncharacterized protein